MLVIENREHFAFMFTTSLCIKRNGRQRLLCDGAIMGLLCTTKKWPLFQDFVVDNLGETKSLSVTFQSLFFINMDHWASNNMAYYREKKIYECSRAVCSWKEILKILYLESSSSVRLRSKVASYCDLVQWCNEANAMVEPLKLSSKEP